MVSTDLFQAFRWAENGACGEQRENNKQAGIEKLSNMSIAQWRPYFYCQCIRPTQLVDPQLILSCISSSYYAYIMYIYFLVTCSCTSMTCFDSSATLVFRIAVF